MNRDNKKEFIAAAYVRLSKKRLLEYKNLLQENEVGACSDSINNQKLLISEFINQKSDNIKLYKFYVDDGFTGLNFERPAFTRMMEDIRNGIVNLVIVKDTSRLGREFILTNNLTQRTFPSLGVRYISVLDDYDSFKDTTREDMLIFKSLYNESYAKDISNKVKGSFSCKIAAGQFIGAFAPYGYLKDKNNKNALVIDEEVAPIVRKIFDMYISGSGKQTIARYLTSKGIPTPHIHKENIGLNYKNSININNNLWSYSTINTILKNRVYCGDLVQHKTVSNFRLRKRTQVSPDSYIISKSTHTAIIDTETFEIVQELLQKRARNMCTSPTGEVSIYAGKIFCGDCGKSLTRTRCGSKDVDKKVYYRCSTYKYQGVRYCSIHSIRLDVLTDIVLNVIKAKVHNVLQEKENNSVSHIMKSHLSDRQKNIKKDISKLESHISTLLNRQKKLFMLFLDCGISKEQFTDCNNSISNKITSTQDMISKLKSCLADEKKILIDLDLWYNHYIKYINITTLNRNVINDLISRIDVYDTEHGLKINICFRFANPLAYKDNDNSNDVKISKSVFSKDSTCNIYDNITILSSEVNSFSHTGITDNKDNEINICDYYNTITKDIKLPKLTEETIDILGSKLTRKQ